MTDLIYDVAFRPAEPTKQNPDGVVWFLFSPSTGETLRDNFTSKKTALSWALWEKYGWPDGSGHPVPPSAKHKTKVLRV